MADVGMIMRERQRDAFRVATASGLTFKQLEHRTGHPERTLRSWADGSACAPLSALDGLMAGLPDEAFALLLPDRVVLMALPEGMDHADFAARCGEFGAEFAKALHPASDGGAVVTEAESDELARRRAAMGAG